MKEFENGRVQFINGDLETDETYTLSISNLVPDVDTEAVLDVGQALASMSDGYLDHAKVVETHRILV